MGGWGVVVVVGEGCTDLSGCFFDMQKILTWNICFSLSVFVAFYLFIH